MAGAQIPVGDVEHNEQAISRSIRRAAEVGAEILLTPEGSLSGYTHDFDTAGVAAALERVTTAAHNVGVGLALGTCFLEDDGNVYNQVRFYGQDGLYLGFHAKELLCGSPDLTNEGKNECDLYATRDLSTFQFGGVTIAGLVCNDLWATPGHTPGSDPYLVREVVRLGAKVIFHAVNGGRATGRRWDMLWNFHEANLRVRAAQFQVPIVTVDNAAPLTLPCSAPGGVVGPDGEWRVRAPRQGEHLFVAEVEV